MMLERVPNRSIQTGEDYQPPLVSMEEIQQFLDNRNKLDKPLPVPPLRELKFDTTVPLLRGIKLPEGDSDGEWIPYPPPASDPRFHYPLPKLDWDDRAVPFPHMYRIPRNADWKFESDSTKFRMPRFPQWGDGAVPFPGCDPPSVPDWGDRILPDPESWIPLKPMDGDITLLLRFIKVRNEK